MVSIQGRLLFSLNWLEVKNYSNKNML